MIDPHPANIPRYVVTVGRQYLKVLGGTGLFYLTQWLDRAWLFDNIIQAQSTCDLLKRYYTDPNLFPKWVKHKPVGLREIIIREL